MRPGHFRGIPVAERLWGRSYFRESGCIEYVTPLGGVGKNGYNLLYVDGLNVMTHRVAYELTHGGIPEGMDILHSCDNRACVNPTHLRPGTHAENMADMRERGGRKGVLQGSTVGTSRLTEAQVLEIRSRRANGETQEGLAREFGITQATVSKIELRKTWIHV